MLIPKTLLTYFRTYRKYIGRRLAIVFALSFLAVLVEAFGITLVLPLIASLEMEGGAVGSELQGVAAWVRGIVQTLGIEHSPIGIIALIGALIGLKGLIRFSSDGYANVLATQLQREIRRKLFDAYAGMDYRYYTAHNTGHFVNLITTQVTALIRSFESFKAVVIASVTMAGYLAVAIMVDWRFAMMAVAAGGTVLLVFRGLNEYVKVLSRKAADENGTLNKHLVQSMQAYKYLVSTATIGPLANRVGESIHRLTRYYRNQGLAGAFTAAVREPVAIGVILLVLVVHLYLFDAAIAPILVSLILLYRAMGQIMLLQGSWQRMMNDAGSLEVVESEFARVGNSQEQAGERELGPFSRAIELDGVRYRYSSGGTEVLRGVTMTIPSCHTLAIVGPSGAGKSTLVDLLTLLLQPTDGELRIDGVSGSEVQLASWRRQIGYVSQDAVVFDDTVANNIGLWAGRYGEKAIYSERIAAAAEQANAAAFIGALPNGYATVVGDRGILLSGGQKQRLFIARELFKNPRLLILDEATSALDSESEKEIQQSIDRLKGKTTIVIIAHRLSTIKNADMVYVLESGQIVEHGTYHELAAHDGSRFSRMVAMQTL